METVGGQAVIEGVMMRNKDKVAVAMRTKEGIKVKDQPFKSLASRYGIFKLPLVRGAVGLFEMLILGMKALTLSANEQSEEEGEELSKMELALTITVALCLTVLLFIVIPFFVARIFVDKGILFNTIDGLLRIGIFVGYLGAISLMSDVKRIFEYHGAEHKAVNCYEAGKDLSVENVSKFSTVHPRCGTTFVVIVLVISIIVFSLITHEGWLVKLLSRVLLLPVIAGVSYEFLKFGGAHYKNKVVAFFLQPGLWFQRITTREPSKDQVEVAIAALRRVL